jgi:hypothetical protein
MPRSASTPVYAWLQALADPVEAGPLPREPLVPDQLEALRRIADRHGVLPLVAEHLAKPEIAERVCSSDNGPQAVVPILVAARRRMAQHSAVSMLLVARAKDVLAALRQAGISACLIKGPSAATRLYPRPSLRPFIDIDILVPYDQWQAAESVMLACNLQRESGSHKYEEGYAEQAWTDPASPGSMFEMHYDLVGSPKVRCAISLRYEDLQFEEANGSSDPGTLQPTPASMLMIAAVHGAVGHGFDKLQHLCDVLQAARGTAGPIDEAWLAESAMASGRGLSLKMALDLAARIFNEPRCRELLDRLRLGRQRVLTARLITPPMVLRSQASEGRRSYLRRQLFRELLKLC